MFRGSEPLNLLVVRQAPDLRTVGLAVVEFLWDGVTRHRTLVPAKIRYAIRNRYEGIVHTFVQ